MSGLTITRKPVDGRRVIYVNGPCKITLVSCNASHARLAIEAEPEVRILRGELKDQPGGVSTEEAKKNGSPF